MAPLSDESAFVFLHLFKEGCLEPLCKRSPSAAGFRNVSLDGIFLRAASDSRQHQEKVQRFPRTSCPLRAFPPRERRPQQSGRFGTVDEATLTPSVRSGHCGLLSVDTLGWDKFVMARSHDYSVRRNVFTALKTLCPTAPSRPLT